MEYCSRLDHVSERPDRSGEFLKSVLIGAGAISCVAPHHVEVEDVIPPGVYIVLDNLSDEMAWQGNEPDWLEYLTEVKVVSDETAIHGQSPISKHFLGLINNLHTPSSWYNDGTELPTDACETYTHKVLNRLFDTYGIIPYKTAVSKEGGIFAAFKTPHDNNVLRIEVDNDLDVVASVSDGNRVLDSGLLEADDVERSIISSFDASVVRAMA